MNTSKGSILNRVFLARLAGTGVFEPNGDQLGKVRGSWNWSCRVQNKEDWERNEQNLADTEYLTRELASLRTAIGEVLTKDYLDQEIADASEEIV